jgi:hypothetical protein
MSIDDERDLRQRLGAAVDAISPGPAPVERAVQQGRAIRLRRRAAALAGIAAVVAAAVAVPAVLHARLSAPVQTRPRHQPVTVNPPGAHAPAGLIAWGRVGSRRWTVIAGRPGADGAGKGQQLVTALGGAAAGPALAYSGPGPVSFDSLGEGAIYAFYGAVRADVAYVQVTLTGGTVLTLHPIPLYGARLVAFAAPPAQVSQVTAWSGNGELAATFPLHAAGALAVFGDWLRPGQPVLPRRTWVIGSGTTAGVPWSVTLYQGPWGRCVVDRSPASSGASCAAPEQGTAIQELGGASRPQVIWGPAARGAAHVVVYLRGGVKVRARVVAAGPGRYFAVATGSLARPQRWIAYDSARQPIGSGLVH